MSNYEHDRIKEILPKIEARTSPTFCLAKWHHVTIYLHLGETHSCYHPQPHVIPLDELKDNPSALHNTKEKKLLIRYHIQLFLIEDLVDLNVYHTKMRE